MHDLSVPPPGWFLVPLPGGDRRAVPRVKRHQQPREGKRAPHQGGFEDDGSD